MGGIDIEVHDMHRLRLLRQQRARARFMGGSTASAPTPLSAADDHDDSCRTDCQNTVTGRMAAARVAVAVRHHCAGPFFLALAEADCRRLWAAAF